MIRFTSFFAENTPIPDPPHLRYLGMLISAVLMIICLLIIFFVVFEFSMDMAGSPVQFTDQYQNQIEEGGDEESTSKEMSLDEIISRFSLLSPLPDSSVQGGEVTILCTWDMSGSTIRNIPFANMLLKVDDFPVHWEVQYGKNTWLIRLKLQPGIHKIQTSCFESRFFVEGMGVRPPENWQSFTMHKDIGDPNRCQECHYWVDRSDEIVRKGHGLTIGVWKGNESCLACHQNEAFAKKHLLIAAPETECRSCHGVHGVVDSEKLLKYPKKEFQ